MKKLINRLIDFIADVDVIFGIIIAVFLFSLLFIALNVGYDDTDDYDNLASIVADVVEENESAQDDEICAGKYSYSENFVCYNKGE